MANTSATPEPQAEDVGVTFTQAEAQWLFNVMTAVTPYMADPVADTILLKLTTAILAMR